MDSLESIACARRQPARPLQFCVTGTLTVSSDADRPRETGMVQTVSMGTAMSQWSPTALQPWPLPFDYFGGTRRSMSAVAKASADTRSAFLVRRQRLWPTASTAP